VEFRVTDVRLMFAIALLFSSVAGRRPPVGSCLPATLDGSSFAER
jgi:hypothetical protein